MLDPILLVLVVIGTLLLGLGIAVLLRGFALRRRLRAQLAGAQHTAVAALFGQASDRQQQRPGPGSLGLTEDELVFVQLSPQRELRIPREDIASVDADRQFMGRTADRELLLVTWQTDGEHDAAAFVLTEVEAWRERLSQQSPAE